MDALPCRRGGEREEEDEPGEPEDGLGDGWETAGTAEAEDGGDVDDAADGEPDSAR
jgi:hypothetical protein